MGKISWVQPSNNVTHSLAFNATGKTGDRQRWPRYPLLKQVTKQDVDNDPSFAFLKNGNAELHTRVSLWLCLDDGAVSNFYLPLYFLNFLQQKQITCVNRKEYLM